MNIHKVMLVSADDH